MAASRKTGYTRRRGAVLIVALLVAALIALVLSSYLNLNLASTRMARRTFNGYGALNLSEAGAEEAVWSFNRANKGDPTAWSGWSQNGTAAWQTLPGFDFGGNTSGWVKVYVDNLNPPANVQPKVIAQSSLGAPGETPVQRMLEVTLRRRTYFANGLVARNSVVFNGASASVDSWNSDPDQDASTPAIAYSAAVRSDHGSVATNAVTNTAVLVNQANVWGFVATGGGLPQVGANGTIRGASTPANVAVDLQRVSTDFNASFDAVTAPVDGTPLLVLPAVLGVLNTQTKWRAPAIVLSGNNSLTIQGDVTLVLTTGNAATAISVTGNAGIYIPAGSSLTVYVEGDIKLAGRGLANSNVQPVSCQIWGTNGTLGGQSIDIAGNGALKTVLYAPQGDVKVNGNGDVMGSIVARNITLVGNAAFHYDESLAKRESNAPFSIAKWREITTASEIAARAPLFNF